MLNDMSGSITQMNFLPPPRHHTSTASLPDCFGGKIRSLIVANKGFSHSRSSNVQLLDGVSSLNCSIRSIRGFNGSGRKSSRFSNRDQTYKQRRGPQNLRRPSDSGPHVRGERIGGEQLGCRRHQHRNRSERVRRRVVPGHRQRLRYFAQ